MPSDRAQNLAFLATLTLVLTAACSAEPGPATPSGGSGGSSGAAAGAVTGGAGVQAGGAAGTTVGGAAGGGPAGGSAGGPAGGIGSGGAAGGGGVSGSGGSGGSGGAGKVPMCLTNDVADGVDRATNNYIECDVEDQAIDFDVAAAYMAPRKPGYDPSTTPVSFTDYGSAFTGSAVQECHPYCYKGNLTLGLDLIAGTEQSLRGEVLFAFPNTVAPIANATGRNSLGWIYVDGPALPAGTKLTLQMVLKSATKGVVLANDTHDVTPGNWFEFKYFPIQNGFAAGDLMGITHIGFRASLTPVASAQNWSGVVYVDHFQLRQ
jgi:hypothetical protein